MAKNLVDGAGAPVVALTRDQIMSQLSARRKTVDVAVPEWGGSVTLRELSARERDAFEASTVDGTGKKMRMNLENLRARLVAACAVDGQGQPLFYPSDIEQLGDLSAAPVSRLFDAARELNGMTDEDVDELVKN